MPADVRKIGGEEGLKGRGPEVEDRTAAQICVQCGAELDEYTGVPGSARRHRHGRCVPFCRECQEAYFDALAKETSPHLAMFYCCIAFDVPFIFRDLPAVSEERDPWAAYLNNIRRTGANRTGESILGFLDGETDILRVFGENLGAGTFKKMVGAERQMQGRRQGSKRQRDDWGEMDGFTQEQYDELDRLYRIQSKPFEAAGIDDLLEYNLREICKNLLRYSVANADGKAKEAKEFLSQAETIKASNLLRKKDEKPVEDLKIDTIVDKLEKKGFMKNGKLLGRDELLSMIPGLRPQYPHSLDAADQMMLCIENTMRRNAGLGSVSELSESMMIDAEAGEFLEEAPEWERDIKKKLELLPMTERRKAVEKKRREAEHAEGIQMEPDGPEMDPA